VLEPRVPSYVPVAGRSKAITRGELFLTLDKIKQKMAAAVLELTSKQKRGRNP